MTGRAPQPLPDRRVLRARQHGRRGQRLHDRRRLQLAVFNRETWRLVRDVELTSPPGYTADEELCSRLWRSYFQRITHYTGFTLVIHGWLRRW